TGSRRTAVPRTPITCTSSCGRRTATTTAWSFCASTVRGSRRPRTPGSSARVGSPEAGGGGLGRLDRARPAGPVARRQPVHVAGRPVLAVRREWPVVPRDEGEGEADGACVRCLFGGGHAPLQLGEPGFGLERPRLRFFCSARLAPRGQRLPDAPGFGDRGAAGLGGVVVRGV